MNAGKTRTSKRIQRRFSVYQQQTPKATEQQQPKQKQENLQQQQQLPQELGQDQKFQYQDEEQKLEQEQEQIKKEVKQEQDLDQELEQEEEKDQARDPQLITEPSLAAEKVSKDTQTNKEQNFWHWVPRRTDDSLWECLVKGKGDEILEAVVTSKSTSRYENVSSHQRSTMQTTETAQHRTHVRTTLTHPLTQCSNPAHEAKPVAMQHRCQNHVASVGCSNYAPGIRHFCQRGIPHGRMPAPQIFPPETQPARNMGLHPGTYSFFGLSAPVQNSVAPQERPQPPNANLTAPPPPLEPSVKEMLATMQEIIAGVLMLHQQQPELSPRQIRGKIRGVFQQMFAEPDNRPQQ